MGARRGRGAGAIVIDLQPLLAPGKLSLRLLRGPMEPREPDTMIGEREPAAIALHYRPDIDGLRAVAVLAVIGFHAFPRWVTGGFIGVDIFFVISGFLISTIIFLGLERGTHSFVDFYARRVRRIFPALLLVLDGVLRFRMVRPLCRRIPAAR